MSLGRCALVYSYERLRCVRALEPLGGGGGTRTQKHNPGPSQGHTLTHGESRTDLFENIHMALRAGL